MGESSGGRPSSIRPPAAVPSSTTAAASAPYHATSAARGRASSAPVRVTASATPRIARSRKSAVAIHPADAAGSANPEMTRYTAFHSAGGDEQHEGPFARELRERDPAKGNRVAERGRHAAAEQHEAGPAQLRAWLRRAQRRQGEDGAGRRADLGLGEQREREPRGGDGIPSPRARSAGRRESGPSAGQRKERGEGVRKEKRSPVRRSDAERRPQGHGDDGGEGAAGARGQTVERREEHGRRQRSDDLEHAPTSGRRGAARAR